MLLDKIIELLDENTDIGDYSDGYSNPEETAQKVLDLIEKEHHCKSCDMHSCEE